MRKLFSKRIFILAITLITCFSSITAFSQDFVFANESETTSSETVLAEAATLSEEASTEAQETESESQVETAESENDSQTEATEDTTESEVTYLEYDDQPTTLEEVQACIDAYVNSSYSLDAKPHWQYEVDSLLMPSGWRCSYVEDENYSEGKYWTVFPKPMFRMSTPGDFDVYDTLIDSFITGFNTLSDAVSYVNGGTVMDAGGSPETGSSSIPYTIKVKADTTLTEMLSITNSGGVTITTDSSAASPVTIERTSTTTSANNTRHFKVESGGKLILEAIILKGDWNGNTDVAAATGGGGVWVVKDGALVLETDAEITNCYRSDIIISGVSTGGSGGAVYVDQGTFTMNGGKIDGNFASALGGGVCVGNSTFDFTNSTPGDYVDASNAASEFYMYGGTIESNTASNTGGGVAVKDNTYFEMSNTDPAITGNITYASSGGVAVEFSTFVLANGSITGNKATAGMSTVPGSTRYNSGGVGIVASEFEMSGGSISDNSAMGNSSSADPEGYGGGVWVGYASKTAYPGSGGKTGNDFYSKFTMTDGKISANYATRSGGGVLVVGGSTFNMSGGEIFNNETGSKGGGVTVSAFAYYNDTNEKPSYFNLSGTAKIYGNYAAKQGGGVAVNASEFTMSGGYIYGNVTTDEGGGVWVGQFEGTGASSIFTMSGGTVGNDNAYSRTTITTATPTATDASEAASASEGNYAAAFGGGIFVGNGTTFTMFGGSVQFNSTSSRAGGVAVKRSCFEMSGGAISSNYATLSGGGVSVASSTFYMHGGSINGTNYTDYSGGGVRVGGDTDAYDVILGDSSLSSTELDKIRDYHGDKSYFYMTDGVITENEATYCGGGVVMRDGAKFYMGSGFYANGVFTSSNTGTTPIISGNKAHYAGGGVFLGTFEIRGSEKYPTFYEDSAKFYMYDGAIIDGNQTEWVKGAYGQWLYGGGVHVNWGCKFEMNDGDIINNTAAYCGGGVSVAGATFTMNGGHISGNSTDTDFNNPSGSGLVAYGGGVWIGHAYTMDPDGDGTYGGMSHPAGSTFTMTGGIIGGAEGLLTAASSGGGTYYGNHAEDDGGGVYVGGDSHFIMSGEAQINHNDTKNGGGGVYVGSGDYGTDSDNDDIADSSFTMVNGYILNNTSYFDGGGVMVKGATFNMSDGYISGNTTTDSTATSGGVYVGQTTNINGTYYGNFTMTGGVIGGLAGYYQGGNSEVDGPYYGNHAVSSGGGVYVTNDAAFTMSGEAQVNYNETEMWGGGVYVTIGEKGIGNTSFTMETGHILNNKALNDAGGLYLSGVKFTLKDGCYISGNKTTVSGQATSGGLLVEDYTNDTTNVTYDGILRIEGGLIGGTDYFVDGTASVAGGPYYGNYAAYYGGGVCAVKAEITMTGGSIAYNRSPQYGGGMCLFGSTFTMEDAVIEGNKGFSGGGVTIYGSTLPATIGRTPSGIVGTSSMTMGGGASVQNNTATSVAGGIEVQGTLTMKTGSLVDNNTASSYGGGIRIYSSGDLTMETGSAVSNNTSRSSGGGVFVHSGASGFMNIETGAKITGNTSNSLSTTNSYGGGGIAITSSSGFQTTIKGTISENKALTTYGGGIYSSGSAAVNISGAKITANMANKDGGGIYTKSTGTLTVSDSTAIANNVALGNGGGICTNNTDYTNLSVLDDTTNFSGNRAAYATNINDTTASSYDSYVSDSITAVSVYTYALNNWDINYAAAPEIYTIIFDPNGGTFAYSVENLQYLYVFDEYVAEPLANLGYVMDSYSDEVMYVSGNDSVGNADAVNNAAGTALVQADMVAVPTKEGGKFIGWNTTADGSGNPLTSATMARTAYYDSTETYTNLLTTTPSTSTTAPKVYAQWNTYIITLALDSGVTWAELADNVAVTFENANTSTSMTALFTDPVKDSLLGDYYTTNPKEGYHNGIASLDTDTWTVTADLPNQYYIKEITIDNGTADTSSVTPTNASSCEIVITIGKTAIPWGHWIYTSH